MAALFFRQLPAKEREREKEEVFSCGRRQTGGSGGQRRRRTGKNRHGRRKTSREIVDGNQFKPKLLMCGKKYDKFATHVFASEPFRISFPTFHLKK